jgi:hypothetical protein
MFSLQVFSLCSDFSQLGLQSADLLVVSQSIRAKEGAGWVFELEIINLRELAQPVRATAIDLHH